MKSLQRHLRILPFLTLITVAANIFVFSLAGYAIYEARQIV